MFNTEYRTQVELLLDILGIMKWDSCFALKGGTSINFFYVDIPRLSVDIDLVYLPIKSRTEAFSQMIAEFQKYSALFNKLNMRAIRSNTSSSNTVGKIIVMRGPARVIIEPNIIVRGTVLEPRFKMLHPKVVQMFGKEVRVCCLNEKELYAGKLLAMLDRQHPRDIFDMMVYIEKGGLINELMDIFIIYLLQTDRPFHELLAPNFLNIDLAYENAFSGMTLEPISLKKLQETRELIVRQVQKNLTNIHFKFLGSVLEGSPSWSLVPFANLQTLSGIQWKLQNIAKMSSVKRTEQIKALESIANDKIASA